MQRNKQKSVIVNFLTNESKSYNQGKFTFNWNETDVLITWELILIVLQLLLYFYQLLLDTRF